MVFARNDYSFIFKTLNLPFIFLICSSVSLSFFKAKNPLTFESLAKGVERVVFYEC